MKAVVEIREGGITDLYFITVRIPQGNSEDGPEFATFVDKTHTTIQIPCAGKPMIKYTAEPPIKTFLDEWNQQAFMESSFNGDKRSN